MCSSDLLAGLDEISRKVTPVVLAPVVLAPVEPTRAPSSRDAWDDDLTPDPFDGALRAAPAANRVRPLSSAPALPLLCDGEDEHGQEFLEFGEAPSAAFTFPIAPVDAPVSAPARALPVTPYGAEPERASLPTEGAFGASLSPAEAVSPLRRSGALPGVSEPPRRPTLAGHSLVAAPMPADEIGRAHV